MNEIIHGDALEILSGMRPLDSVDCIITSPPYFGLRDYESYAQIGRETTIDEYIDRLCRVFDSCKEVLKLSGTCFVNIDDSYNANKSLCGVPERFMLAMLNRGWILRNKIVWNKTNAKPQPALDKFVPSWEVVYFFVLNPKYYYCKLYEPAQQSTINRAKYGRRESAKYVSTGQLMVKEYNQRGMRDVFNIATASPTGIKHIAMYPEKLVKVLLDAGCPGGGVVLDPFVGSGTTAIAAKKTGRKYIGIDTNAEYVALANERLAATQIPPNLMFR